MYKKILLVTITTFIFIGWSGNPLSNTPVCTAEDVQENPQLVSDGNGGAFIAWEDSRKGGDNDIYAQRIDDSGRNSWGENGIPICTAGGPQRFPMVVSDNAGGFIAAWYDRRNGKNYDIYAQRVNSRGNILWESDGLPVCAAPGDQYDPVLVADGSGGAIISWYDRRKVTDYDIYAQRIDQTGKALWTINGIAICREAGDQDSPRMTWDGGKGVIIAWQDRRNGITYDIYAQKLDVFGRIQWSSRGVPVCTADQDQRRPQLAAGKTGGAVVTWQDKRNGSDYDIFAQALDTDGLPQWGEQGLAVCVAANSQYDPQLISDGKGGAIIAWQDYRKGSDCNYDAFSKQTDFDVKVCSEKQLHDWNIYAQYIDITGKIRWAGNGVAICAAQLDQYRPRLVADGRGGAIVAWRASEKESDIYAQRLDASGLVKWSANGVAVSTAAGSQNSPLLVSDGKGGAIIAWDDTRNGKMNDIYTQVIRASGRRGGR